MSSGSETQERGSRSAIGKVGAARGRWAALLSIWSDNFNHLLLHCQQSCFITIFLNLRAICGQLAGSGQLIIWFDHRLGGASIMQKTEREVPKSGDSLIKCSAGFHS